MGGCIGKDSGKVEPNHDNSDTTIVNPRAKLTGDTRHRGADCSTQRGSSSGRRCDGEPDFKESNRLEDYCPVTRASGRDHFKEKRELPKLEKTNGYDKGDSPHKPVAFDITFNEEDFTLQSTPKKLPRRLEKLEGAPALTAELLQQKQEIAEHNRSKELQKRAETISKRRRELLRAREYERLKNAEIQMQAKLQATEHNRQLHVNEVIDKQRRREQKAKQVRARARNDEQDLFHVDETYNSDDSQGASWTDDVETGTQLSCSGLNEDASSTDEFFETVAQVQSINSAM